MTKNNNEEFEKVQDEINKELLEEEEILEKKKKDFHNSAAYIFVKMFIEQLKEDKLFLTSFIITIVFLGFGSLTKIKNSDGFYTFDLNKIDNTVIPDVDNSNGTILPASTSDNLDVRDYIGIYSKEFTLTTPIKLDSSCEITNYKYVYQIKRDKSITKYLLNDCLGTVKIWSDKLSYISNGGARYISSNNINYLFSANSMKEIDGDTFTVDDNISVLRVNKKLSNVEEYFFDNNVVFMTLDNLYLVNGNSVLYDLSTKYINKGGELVKKVYKSDIKNQFNFIVFANSDKVNCYADSKDDKLNYTLYSIKYNYDTKLFNDAKIINERLMKDGCDIYKEDLKTLEE